MPPLPCTGTAPGLPAMHLPLRLASDIVRGSTTHHRSAFLFQPQTSAFWRGRLQFREEVRDRVGATARRGGWCTYAAGGASASTARRAAKSGAGGTCRSVYIHAACSFTWRCCSLAATAHTRCGLNGGISGHARCRPGLLQWPSRSKAPIHLKSFAAFHPRFIICSDFVCKL